MRWVGGQFDFTPHPVSRVCYGHGRLAELPALLDTLNRKRALVVTSPSVRAAGLVARAEGVLGARLVGVFVLDAMRADYFTRYADVMPTLTRLRAEGAWFSEARVTNLPTVTGVGHATIGTGALPTVGHGPVDTPG